MAAITAQATINETLLENSVLMASIATPRRLITCARPAGAVIDVFSIKLGIWDCLRLGRKKTATISVANNPIAPAPRGGGVLRISEWQP